MKVEIWLFDISASTINVSEFLGNAYTIIQYHLIVCSMACLSLWGETSKNYLHFEVFMQWSGRVKTPYWPVLRRQLDDTRRQLKWHRWPRADGDGFMYWAQRKYAMRCVLTKGLGKANAWGYLGSVSDEWMYFGLYIYNRNIYFLQWLLLCQWHNNRQYPYCYASAILLQTWIELSLLVYSYYKEY